MSGIDDWNIEGGQKDALLREGQRLKRYYSFEFEKGTIEFGALKGWILFEQDVECFS